MVPLVYQGNDMHVLSREIADFYGLQVLQMPFVVDDIFLLTVDKCMLIFIL